MAGSLTATPVLVGAKDALNNGLAGITDPMMIKQLSESLSVGYAMSYLVGLVSLIFLAKLMPKLQKQKTLLSHHNKLLVSVVSVKFHNAKFIYLLFVPTVQVQS